VKHWIQAARLRTLPLSLSGILVGSFYAVSQAIFNWYVFLFAILTTLGLQILSNFANDYGDGVKGTDNEKRVGPPRAVQSGDISPAAMKNAMFLTAIITFVLAVLLIYYSFKDQYLYYSLLFLLLGVLAIASAIRYTVGNNPYGYQGFGDVFVYIFFGLVSTFGVYFLITKRIDWLILLPATTIGLLSVGVLNLNNMRDIASDKLAGKNTLVVKIGLNNAKKYHFAIIFVAMFASVLFAWLKDFNFDQYLFVLAYIPILRHLTRVRQVQVPQQFDPELKKLAFSTFFYAILMALSMIFFLSDIIMRS
jgi:1,4-dihydroxy-2-naphthoate octaprenyltransferase